MGVWQKVRVSFNDADGSEVSAVMFKEPRGDYYVTKNGGGACVMASKDLTVAPIRDLPTGVGAVIRVNKPQFSDTRDLYTHVGGGWWTNLEGDDVSATAEDNGFDKKSWPWEILSEGIQL
jgi:hypothetical protein